MKKQLFLVAAGILVLAISRGQNYSNSLINIKNEMPDNNPGRGARPDEVGDLVKLQFRIDFGARSNVTWSKVKTHSGDFDKATFMSEGRMTNAYYDYNNRLVGATYATKYEEIPARARNEIATKYRDYSVGDVILFDDNEYNDTDMELYNTAFEDEDNYFVELSKPDKVIVLKVSPAGFVSFFTEIK